MHDHPELFLRLAQDRHAELRKSAWNSRLRRDERQSRRRRGRSPS